MSVDELELPAPRSSVTTGGVLSAATVVVVVVVVVVVEVVVAVVVVVVVAATVEVVLEATVVVAATEMTVHSNFLPDLAHTSLEPPTSITLPALTHLAPDRVSVDAVKG